jgi:hypothetical protein
MAFEGIWYKDVYMIQEGQDMEPMSGFCAHDNERWGSFKYLWIQATHFQVNVYLHIQLYTYIHILAHIT